jgi:hypothetical protein
MDMNVGKSDSLFMLSTVSLFVCLFDCLFVDKPLARPGRKQATATEDSDVHISYL